MEKPINRPNPESSDISYLRQLENLREEQPNDTASQLRTNETTNRPSFLRRWFPPRQEQANTVQRTGTPQDYEYLSILSTYNDHQAEATDLRLQFEDLERQANQPFQDIGHKVTEAKLTGYQEHMKRSGSMIKF